MEFIEQTPEEIGTLENGEFIPSVEASVEPEMPPEQEEMEEVPESVIPPEKIKELAELLVTTVVQSIEPDFQSKLSEKEKELEDGRVGFDDELAKRDEEKMGMEETHKKMSKEMEGKHKENLKGKDKEINELKKQLKDKEKEIKELLKQVKEALNEED